MKKIISFAVLFLFSGTFLFSQLSEKATKQRDKANAKYKDGKYDEAEKMLDELVKEYPYSGSCWDILANVKFAQYAEAKKTGGLLGGNMTVTVTGKDGKEEKNDSLAKSLANTMNDIFSGKSAFKAFMDVCREATLKSGNCYGTSILIRAANIDVVVDTLVKTKAYEAFQDAEKEFQKQNYDKAKKYYKKAADLDTGFYKARLYLGDAYYAHKEYAEATKYFKEAVKVQPTLQEPRKFLVDALAGLGEWEHAQTECIKTLMLYPDIAMFYKLEEIAGARGKKFQRLWSSRPLYPNVNQKQTYDGKDENWKNYLGAMAEIKPFCDENGMITKTTTLTKSKYAEVYAWEKMLKMSPADRFGDAKALQEAGYLDCYVLFSLYHFDLQTQFRDLATTNPSHLENYVDILMGLK